MEGPRMEKDVKKDWAFFYVLSLRSLARHRKRPNPRKLG